MERNAFGRVYRDECDSQERPAEDIPYDSPLVGLSSGWTETQQLPMRANIPTTKRHQEPADEAVTIVARFAGNNVMVPSNPILFCEASGNESEEQWEAFQPVEMGREAARVELAMTGLLEDQQPAEPVESFAHPHASPQPEARSSSSAPYQGGETDPDPYQDSDPETMEEQSSGAAADNSFDIAEDTGGDLVHAILIHDIDDSSEHTDADLPPPMPSITLVRDAITGAIAVESDTAVVQAMPVELVATKIISRRRICAVMFLLLLVIAALGVGFLFSAQRHGSKSSSFDGAGSSLDATILPTVSPSPFNGTSSKPAQIPVLQQLREPGRALRCGVVTGPALFYLNEDGEPSGFDAALCAAVAAAATGDAKNVEYHQLEFQGILESLHLGEVDIVAAGMTHTMERQVYQSGAKAGFAFTVPYLYQGLQLAGEPSLVECGDQGLEYIAACSHIRVCVIDQSTHQQTLSSYLPGQKLIAISDPEILLKSLANGTCNVIAHEGYSLAESLVRAAGYEGPYKVGRKLFSKEPLAMATTSDNPQFSDFANSVVQALVVAEANNITQSTAAMFEQTNAFGEEYKDMFRNAIASVGNYGELYEKFLEPFISRQGLNVINDGDATTAGLLYSHPFGTVTEKGEAGGVLLSVKRRGFLRCGVRFNRVGFAEMEHISATGSPMSTRGLEIDYCRAIAGSIFAADGDAVQFIEVVDEGDGFVKLAAGDVDVLAGATWSFLNDVLGFSFSQPYFYGSKGTTVEVENLCLATKQNDFLWSSYVYWIAAAIVQAEESKIGQGMSNSMPPVYLFGEEFYLCFQDAILTVGNQKEIYDRNLASIIPRGGRNVLNGNVGPLMYPIPGLMDTEK